MQSEIPDLWPAEVGRVQVITPLLILRHQAGLLRQRSMNLLEAEVTTESDSRGPLDVAHYLELVVAVARPTSSAPAKRSAQQSQGVSGIHRR